MYLPIYVIIGLNTHAKGDRKVALGRENVQSHSMLTNWQTYKRSFWKHKGL